MFTKLRLERFKNFQEAELHLGPLTVLVGENASGKSNIRDAFRFLHGVGRGYSLADIVGGKFGEGGETQWNGIRGGSSNVLFDPVRDFKLGVTISSDLASESTYEIEVGIVGQPLLLRELFNGTEIPAKSTDEHPLITAQNLLTSFVKGLPFIAQVEGGIMEKPSDLAQVAKYLKSMRFYDFDPNALRRSSLLGQTVLGDRGENLVSVLKFIYEDEPHGREILVSWLRALTPMDAVDFEFIPDVSGRLTLVLVEEGGRKTTAYSASDGTLRFLGMIAALLGPNPARFNFFEEIDTGLHPTRLHLLLQLIEQRVTQGDMQVVVTTHSPQLLNALSDRALQDTSLVYRLEGQPDAHITRIVDLPDAPRIMETYDPAELFASGWMETTAAFASDGEGIA